MSVLRHLSGSDLSKVSYAYRYALERLPADSLDNIAEKWISNSLKARFAKPQQTPGGILCLRSLVRDDYKELFHAVLDRLPQDKLRLVEDFRLANGDVNDGFLSYLMDHSPWVMEHLNCTESAIRAAVGTRLCLYGYFLDQHFKNRPNAVLCFASMQPIEHMACLIAKRLNIPTITLQHGLYVDYGDYDTVNKINYLHQPADYFLAWGQATAALIEKHHPATNIFIVGKPSIYQIEESTNSGKNAVMVITDQKIFEEENVKMLELVCAYAKKFGKKVYVRFHPSNNKKWYTNKFPEIIERSRFDDCDLVVGHTSSMIYESFSLGLNTVRYMSDIPAIPFPSKLCFNSLEELELASSIGIDENYDISHYIKCFGDESGVAHHKALKSILPGMNL